ncbi:MAG: zinc metallopeptidase [Lachnospiraceae bacterium]|nr:zinc metallopeptidase [Lachnospiraceae bacterium]
MKDFLTALRNGAQGSLDGVSDIVILAMVCVVALIILLSIVALGVSLWLGISYMKYNRKQNSAGKSGEEIARRLLDSHGLQHIRVTKTGSMLFGNSYSHYFKKVRLRRLTWQKKSVTSLAMAAQKSSLAVLDKENDADMQKRIKLTPVMNFGPLAFVPLVMIGLILDLFVLKSGNGICTIVLSVVGLVFYLLAFVMSLLVLKTEKKAQVRAVELMREQSLATEEEIEMCRKLFRLYNIEYVNDMLMALLELIYRVLQIIAAVQNNKQSK